MAKYTMHDYEKEMREEERQTELQEALEAQRAYESRDAEDNWRKWKDQQRAEMEVEMRESMYADDYDDFLLYDWGIDEDFGDVSSA